MAECLRYLLVTTDKIAKSVDSWRKKYKSAKNDVLVDSVESLFELPVELLKSEKDGNIQGMMNDQFRHLSNAKFGG